MIRRAKDDELVAPIHRRQNPFHLFVPYLSLMRIPESQPIHLAHSGIGELILRYGAVGLKVECVWFLGIPSIVRCPERDVVHPQSEIALRPLADLVECGRLLQHRGRQAGTARCASGLYIRRAQDSCRRDNEKHSNE